MRFISDSKHFLAEKKAYKHAYEGDEERIWGS